MQLLLDEELDYLCFLSRCERKSDVIGGGRVEIKTLTSFTRKYVLAGSISTLYNGIH